ncbi:MAG: nucleobase:cation symporter, family, partial [Streptomyces sp.]|nr:nucleobase:cation symporter, family [Streptomyces sp.]
MTATAPPPSPAQRTQADGRVELPSDAIPSGPYANEDLLPVPLAQRKWTTYNFAALWVGMA